jgi:hypothetical protein
MGGIETYSWKLDKDEKQFFAVNCFIQAKQIKASCGY